MEPAAVKGSFDYVYVGGGAPLLALVIVLVIAVLSGFEGAGGQGQPETPATEAFGAWLGWTIILLIVGSIVWLFARY